ncbi:MAG: MBL fold metallo-hydrolase [Deltaproteobacteria bacterium]|nr:MBL fold metallo-hydrolase [Deltaproteobacteria bacterium]
MKIKIHKGSHEIGGTCIELEQDGTSVLLDIGQPLKKGSKPADLGRINPSAVIISHPHQDHCGLIEKLPVSVPVYCGECAHRLMDASRVFRGLDPLTHDFRQVWHRRPFQVGPFWITPFLMDHSAVDAFALLVEAGGKRVLYSGDFRAHGRKGKLFDWFIRKPPRDIDVLLMEGTMVGTPPRAMETEDQVEEAMWRVFRVQKNISFVIASAQNIDRVVSVYRACLKAHKTLVVDQYTAWVLEQVRQTISPNTPALGWDKLAAFRVTKYTDKINSQPKFFGDFQKLFERCRVFGKTMKAKPQMFVSFNRSSTAKPILSYVNESKGPVNVIYSQWSGYLKDDRPDMKLVESLQRESGIRFQEMHTGGHASIDDLSAFAQAVDAAKLVPIHSECVDQFERIFENVVRVGDLETIIV